MFINVLKAPALVQRGDLRQDSIFLRIVSRSVTVNSPLRVIQIGYNRPRRPKNLMTESV